MPRPIGARLHRASRSVLAMLAVGLLLLPGTGSVRAADPSADIPGVTLPGPIAAGRLGGGIYDVVYRLDVEPGHVIVASITGTTGTDFDLYLFDSTATTVVSPTGLVAKSTGPTSTESVSWPTRTGGTYYIDLNGATDVEGDYRLTVQTLPDGTPPLLSLRLGGGAASTNQTMVPVTLIATEDLSGIAEMAFSPDGVHFGAWQPFATSTDWTFGPGDGPRFLWAKVRNGVGLESAVAGASIVVDTVAPTVISIDPPVGSRVAGLRPTLTVGFDEPINPATWLDLGLVVQSSSGPLVPGSYAYDPTTRRGTFTPASDLIAGAVYAVTVGDVKDVAGNRVLFGGSWSLTALIPTRLSALATPRVVLRGASARIDLSLIGAPLPATIDVSVASGGGPFEPRPSIPTVDGSNILEVTPASNMIVRLSYAGTASVAAAQTDVTILVRRSVSLVGRTPSRIAGAQVGTPVRLTAQVGPAASGVSASFRLYRFDSAHHRWVYAGSNGRRTDATGRAMYTWVPPTPGSFYWRVVVASTVDFANNTSAVYRWTVSR